MTVHAIMDTNSASYFTNNSKKPSLQEYSYTNTDSYMYIAQVWKFNIYDNNIKNSQHNFKTSNSHATMWKLLFHFE